MANANIIDPTPMVNWAGFTISGSVGPYQFGVGRDQNGWYGRPEFNAEIQAERGGYGVKYDPVTGKTTLSAPPGFFAATEADRKSYKASLGFEISSPVFGGNVSFDWGRVGQPISINGMSYVRSGAHEVIRTVKTGARDQWGPVVEATIFREVAPNQYVKVSTQYTSMVVRWQAENGIFVHGDDTYTRTAKCFPGNVLVLLSDGSETEISNVRIGDSVLAFDPSLKGGRGDLVSRRVTRVFRNTTHEWFRLSWSGRTGPNELVVTPGHHFLDQFGAFPQN